TIRVMPGQTQSEIRRLLAEAGLAPQHRLGQNFLIDLNLMRKVVAGGEVQPADTVLEIGAGTGSLTELLLQRGARVVAVEIDRGLQGVLRARLGEHPRFTLVQGDALGGKHRVNPLVLKVLSERPPAPGGAYKLVANLPYQIATPLLMDLLLAAPRFARLTATIQREVGERLAAHPRTEAYGPVSVVMQTLAEVTPLAILPPTAFWPRPQVESLLVAIRPRPLESVNVDDVTGFVAFVQRGFQQRRKMLRRLVRDLDAPGAALVFQRAGVSPDARAEELSPPDWRGLFAAWRRSGR
ncbi:MAG TPA: 16S rRNA (adenine(1518)-N(6)/adenine(1519)-N(6))-dimethyltransferase RsmA, partial [Phycisphaerae bacterium]|nr:16S rRNA (adenine(1518)-N(6)/adenine(1519)-N(6))-dimethyltransferase RsmA [Phycisphaerae bacterium]